MASGDLGIACCGIVQSLLNEYAVYRHYARASKNMPVKKLQYIRALTGVLCLILR